MNYAALFSTVKSYSENDFPAAVWTDPAGTGTVTLTQKEQIDTFIRQAEQRIYNTVQLPATRKNMIGTCTINNRYLSLPPDWLATYSLSLIRPDGSQEFLLNKDVEFIRAMFPDPADTGEPTHYAIFDSNTFILGPTPDATYAVELYYYAYPTSIVDSITGTTWLGDNFDSALLYGALLEAYTFMKGEADLKAEYKLRYDEVLKQLQTLGEGKNRQDAYRTGQVRRPVA
jgi:hypothetical protein